MHAYRTPALVDADPLPDTCVPHRPPPRRGLAPTFANALAAATSLFLLVSSAAIGALTCWTLLGAPPRREADVSQATSPPPMTACYAMPASAQAPRPVPRTFAPPRSSQRAASRAPAFSPLARMGRETHEVEALWRRALDLKAHGAAGLTVGSFVFRPGMIAPARVQDPMGALRWEGVGERRLVVGPLDNASPMAQAGVRRGDRIRAINGYTFRNPADVLDAWSVARFQRAAVVEIDHPAGGRVALRVDIP